MTYDHKPSSDEVLELAREISSNPIQAAKVILQYRKSRPEDLTANLAKELTNAGHNEAAEYLMSDYIRKKYQSD